MFEIVYCEKGTYLFHEGDKPSCFYGIITGKISMRHKIEVKPEKKIIIEKIDNKKHIKLKKISGMPNFLKKIANSNKGHLLNTILKKEKDKNKKDKVVEKDLNKVSFSEDEPKQYIEEELFSKADGYCFGELGLLYDIPRTSSCYCLENTYFFSLSEEHFKNTLLKALNKSEGDKRGFLRDHLFPFDDLKPEHLDILQKNIIPIQVTTNQIIFQEREKAESIFLVYMNQFTLEKKFISKNFQTFQNYEILKIEKGGVIGLESLYEDKIDYHFSLRADCRGELGVIFSLKVAKIPDIVLNKMKKYFTNYYATFTNTVQKFCDQKKELDNKTQNKNINKYIFQSMTDSEKCQSAINIYFSKIHNESTDKINRINDFPRGRVIGHFNLKNAILLKGNDFSKQSSINASFIYNKLSKHNRSYSKNNGSPDKSTISFYHNSSRKEKKRKSIIISNDNSRITNLSFQILPKMKLPLDNTISKKSTNNMTSRREMTKIIERKKKKHRNRSFTEFEDNICRKYGYCPKFAFDSGSFNIPLVSKILQN